MPRFIRSKPRSTHQRLTIANRLVQLYFRAPEVAGFSLFTWTTRWPQWTPLRAAQIPQLMPSTTRKIHKYLTLDSCHLNQTPSFSSMNFSNQTKTSQRVAVFPDKIDQTHLSLKQLWTNPEIWSRGLGFVVLFSERAVQMFGPISVIWLKITRTNFQIHLKGTIHPEVNFVGFVSRFRSRKIVARKYVNLWSQSQKAICRPALHKLPIRTQSGELRTLSVASKLVTEHPVLRRDRSHVRTRR